MNVKRIAKIDKALILDALFLMDWKHTLMTGKSFLEIKEKNGRTVQFLWQYTNRGPYTTISEKELRKLKVPEEIYEFVLEKVERLKYTGIKNLVFSTYPMLVTEKYDFIDLEKLEKEYKERLSKKELLEVENIKFEDLSLLKKIKLFIEKLIPKRGLS